MTNTINLDKVIRKLDGQTQTPVEGEQVVAGIRPEDLALDGPDGQGVRGRVTQIADLLSLSPRTIGTHLYNIKQKLGAQNAAELTLIALHAGLLNEGM